MTLTQAITLAIFTTPVQGSVDIIGAGYDIIHGNPDGINPVHGGLDPGILSNQILETNSEAVVSDIKKTCKSSETVEWFFNPYSYQEKLLQSIESSGKGDSTVRRVAFTGSSHFTVSDTFAAAVCDLSNDKTQYERFIKTWGTHVIVEAELGTRTFKRYEIDDVELFQYLVKNVPEAVLETGDGSSRKIDFNVFATNNNYKAKLGQKHSTSNIGTTENLAPIRLRLISIDTIIQKKFWNIDRLIEQGICNDKTTMEAILAKESLLLDAMDEYQSKFSPVVTAPYLIFPIEWPIGTYILQQARVSGYDSCPTRAKWTTGSVRWQTQKKNNKNAASTDNHFTMTVYKDKTIQMSYCGKNDKTYSQYDLEWPVGDYCIFKYNSCPAGFQEGSVQWDTDNGAYESNQAYGMHPDGVYKRDVLMYFCCRNDSNIDTIIYLPTNKPFYLLRNDQTDGCQKVAGMSVREEFQKWDTLPSMSVARNAHPMVEFSDTYDITMFFCYYSKYI